MRTVCPSVCLSIFTTFVSSHSTVNEPHLLAAVPPPGMATLRTPLQCSRPRPCPRRSYLIFLDLRPQDVELLQPQLAAAVGLARSRKAHVCMGSPVLSLSSAQGFQKDAPLPTSHLWEICRGLGHMALLHAGCCYLGHWEELLQGMGDS